MKIKGKLQLGTGLLLLMIVVVAAIGMHYINILKNDTNIILIDNYQSLEYARNMLDASDRIPDDAHAVAQFDSNLVLQQKNITEQGEQAATDAISELYQKLRTGPADPKLLSVIRANISKILQLNSAAIQRKSNIAVSSVRTANLWIAITGTICCIIALTLFMNLPGSIADPFHELAKSIREIAAKNYSQRIHFNRKDEFGELAASFNIMAEKLEEYDNSNLSQILIEKKRVETLINNMLEAVIGLDENQNILFANEQAVKITGLTMEELVGQHAPQVAAANDLVRSLIHDEPNQDGKPSPPLKIYVDQKESYFEKELVDITISPTGEKRKVFIGRVIILKNITSFKELDFAKTNFIATVSHELKTPISSIKMSLKLLESPLTGSMNTDQLELMESIREDSDRLLKITGELLNLSQLETGNIQLSIQESDAIDIISYALDTVKTTADQKQIRIITDLPKGLPLVKADVEKTAWVLVNFLTNAIRHSEENSPIEIRLRFENRTLQFSVTDQGKGIDGPYRDKVFERYFQVPGSGKSGTGLGLAISKEFIEAQGGSIGVESELGTGSRFYFFLPTA
jgi:two-component system, NtrC family, sensor histidine kinase KinB